MRAALDARTGIGVCRKTAWERKNELITRRLDFSEAKRVPYGRQKLHGPCCRKRQVLQMDDGLRRRYPVSPPIRLLTAV